MGRHASSHLWASATSLDAPEWFQSPRHARPDMLGRPLAEQLVATRHNLSPEESYRSVSSKPLGGRTLVSPHRLVSPDTPKEWRADERRFYGQGDYANISASLPKLSVRAFADRPTAAQSPANSPLPRIQQWYETHSRDKFANTPPTTVKSLLDTNASLWSIASSVSLPFPEPAPGASPRLGTAARKYRRRRAGTSSGVHAKHVASPPPFVAESHSFVSQTSDAVACKSPGIRWPSRQTQAHRDKPATSWHAGVPAHAATCKTKTGETVEQSWKRPQRERSPLLRKSLLLGRRDVELENEGELGTFTYAGGKTLVQRQMRLGTAPSSVIRPETSFSLTPRNADVLILGDEEPSINDVPSLRSIFEEGFDTIASEFVTIAEESTKTRVPIITPGSGTLALEVSSVRIDPPSHDRYEHEQDLLTDLTGRVRVRVSVPSNAGADDAGTGAEAATVAEFTTEPSELDYENTARWGVAGSGIRTEFHDVAPTASLAVDVEHEVSGGARWVRTAHTAVQVPAGDRPNVGGLNNRSSVKGMIPQWNIQLTTTYGGRSANISMRAVRKLHD